MGNLNAQNPNSSAWGIFQFLNTSYPSCAACGSYMNADLQQQAAAGVAASGGPGADPGDYSDWGPDLGCPNFSSPCDFPLPGSPVYNWIQTNALTLTSVEWGGPAQPTERRRGDVLFSANTAIWRSLSPIP